MQKFLNLQYFIKCVENRFFHESADLCMHDTTMGVCKPYFEDYVINAKMKGYK